MVVIYAPRRRIFCRYSILLYVVILGTKDSVTCKTIDLASWLHESRIAGYAHADSMIDETRQVTRDITRNGSFANSG